MIFIFFKFFFMFSSVSWAEEGYFFLKNDCHQDGGIQSETIYAVSPKILLNCPHDQGESKTCVYHAITALLTALYKSTRPSIEDSDNLDVLDLIRQMSADCAKGVNFMESFFQVKRQVHELSEHCGLTVKEYVALATQENFSIDAVFKGKELKKHSLPKFNAIMWLNLDKDRIFTVIKDHFKLKSATYRGPLLPILFTVRLRSTIQESHLLLVTSLIETTCQNGRVHHAVGVQNSYGIHWQGPYDLWGLARGAEGLIGSVVTIVPAEAGEDGKTIGIQYDTNPGSVVKGAVSK